MRAPLAFRTAWTDSRYRLAAWLIAGLMGVSLAVRLVLLVLQHALVRDGLVPVLASLGAGELFDTVAALWLAAPLVLYLAVVPERWFRHRAQRTLIAGGFGLAAFAVLFVAVAEIFFFQEFNGRFNFVAVDYLMYPTEVVQNIWESYPTGLILAGLAALSAGASLLLRRPCAAHGGSRSRWAGAAPPRSASSWCSPCSRWRCPRCSRTSRRTGP